MSNKKTIKRRAEPVSKVKKEEKPSGSAKGRRKLASLIPAIVFIVFAIWYFISSLR